MFLHLQKSLRSLNSDHDIDLTSTHGVIIGGRHYPAIHKHIDLGDEDDQKNGDYSASFRIPVENGTQLEVNARNESGSEFNFLSQSSQLLVPTIHFDHEGVKSYEFGPALHVGEDAYYAAHKKSWLDIDSSDNSDLSDVQDIHETIREHSKLPRQGTFDWTTQGGYKAFSEVRPNHTHWAFGVEGRDLDQEDLAEHRNNYKFNPLHGPLHIATSTWIPDLQKKFKYRYNIGTEQMHLMGGDED